MGFWVRGVEGLGRSERVSGYWVCLVGSKLRDWAGIGFRLGYSFGFGLFRKGLRLGVLG